MNQPSEPKTPSGPVVPDTAARKSTAREKRPAVEKTPASGPAREPAASARPEPVKPPAKVAAAVIPPPLPPRSVASSSASPESASATQTASWLSAAELQWRKWLLWAGAPAAGLAVVVGLVSMLVSTRGTEPAPDAEVEATAEAAVVTPVVKPSEPSRLDPRWIPDETRLVVSLKPSRLAGQSGADRMFEAAGPFWNPVLGAAVEAFSLGLGDVRRISWAAIDLADCSRRGVIVIETEDGKSLESLWAVSQPTNLHLDGVACHRLDGTAWPHPFAVFGQHTLVTGDADSLAELAARSKPHFANAAVGRLIETVAGDADAVLVVDLAAARRAAWPLPERLLDVWPTGARAWHAIWAAPRRWGSRFGWTARSGPSAILSARTRRRPRR